MSPNVSVAQLCQVLSSVLGANGLEGAGLNFLELSLGFLEVFQGKSSFLEQMASNGPGVELCLV